MLDSFLSAREAGSDVRVSDRVAEAVAKSARTGPAQVVVVRVVRGGEPAETLACVPDELRELEQELGASGADSWTIERRSMSVGDLEGG